MKKYKARLIEYNIDFKKEMKIIAAFFIIYVLALITFIVFFRNVSTIIFLVFLLALLCISYYIRIESIIKKTDEKRYFEFINLLSLFRIFLENNMEIYQSLNELLPFSTNWMKTKLNLLIDEINDDKSIKPFINFSRYFKNEMAKTILITIFQMFDTGIDANKLINFSYQHEKSLDYEATFFSENVKQKFDSVIMFSLLGAGIFTFALMIGIINLLGEMTYGF